MYINKITKESVIETYENGKWHLVRMRDEIGTKGWQFRHINGTKSRFFTKMSDVEACASDDLCIKEDDEYNAPRWTCPITIK